MKACTEEFLPLALIAVEHVDVDRSRDAVAATTSCPERRVL